MKSANFSFVGGLGGKKHAGQSPFFGAIAREKALLLKEGIAECAGKNGVNTRTCDAFIG